MEVKEEAKKIIIAKPLATRPSPSSLRSFSELLRKDIDSSPAKRLWAPAATAIRPATSRLKPSVDHISAQAADSKSNVIRRPMPKRVSSSVLEKLGNFNTANQQVVVETEADVGRLEGVPILRRQESEFHQNLQRQSDGKEAKECSKWASENPEDAQKSVVQTRTSDHMFCDGYSWRKYGQKQVKGSEYRRSYYKCAHPNCTVKKKVETSVEGRIAGIVYQGEHIHLKPRSLQLGSSNGQKLRIISDATGQDANGFPGNKHLREKHKGYEGSTGNDKQVRSARQCNYSSGTHSFYNLMLGGQLHEGVNTEALKEGGYRHRGRKRMRNQYQKGEFYTSEQYKKDLHDDSGTLGDGFRWRKYGQKVVRGNSHPRSYYKCTNLHCNARKYVERSSDDPEVFVTTYEGRHNHDIPEEIYKSGGIPLSTTLTKSEL